MTGPFTRRSNAFIFPSVQLFKRKMPALKKKVLIVTYYFPPSGGSGVQRPLKFIKYLREFGWEPVVLTAKNADYPAYDETLVHEIPDGVKIYRSGIVEPYRFYRKFTGRSADESTDIATLTLDERDKQKFSERLSEWVRSALFVPDARIGWLPFAYSLAKKIIFKENIEIVLSTAPPYTTHLIGMLLHRNLNVPWIADFRDSWIGWLSTPQWRPKLSRALERWMESSALRYADRVVTVTPGVKEDLLSRNPRLRDERWKLLYNGFDPADFAQVRPKPKQDKTTIIYSGSLYGNRNPEYLLRALEELKTEDPELLNKIRLLFVGRIGGPIIERMETSPVAGIIERVPYVTHAESLSYLAGSNISLLIIDDAPENAGILTGKLFEYIGAGHPVLALAPEGNATDLIRENKLGIVAHPKRVDEIKKALINIVASCAASEAPPDPSLTHKFERRTLTGQLAKMMDELSEQVQGQYFLKT